MESDAGIYQIKNQVNGKCYIGSSVNLHHRRERHLSELRHGKHRNRHLQRAFDKYGEATFVFEILEHTASRNLIEQEQLYLDELKPEYNISPTAGSRLGCHPSLETRRKLSEAGKGRHQTEETKRKISEARKGERNPFYGRHHSDKTRARMSDSHKGVQFSAERRKKISEALSGKHLGAETRRKIGEALKGKHPSAETRRKMSEAKRGERNPNYGKHPSEETRRKMSTAQAAYWRRVRATTCMRGDEKCKQRL